MSDTLSTMIPLGFEAPSFKLLDVKSNVVLNSNKLFGLKATVLMFICNHCPYVKVILDKLVVETDVLAMKGIGCVAINPNDFTPSAAAKFKGPELLPTKKLEFLIKIGTKKFWCLLNFYISVIL